MRSRSLLLLGALAMGASSLVLVACGDDDDGGSTADTGVPTPTPPTPPGTPPTPPGTPPTPPTPPGTPPTPPPTDGGVPIDGAPADGMVAPSGMSRIERTCGPADGLAYLVTIAQGGPRCEPDISRPHIQLYLFGDLPTAGPHTVTLAPENGTAQRCEGSVDGGTPECELADPGGTVTFDTFEEGVSTSGTFAIDFGSDHIEGFFTAIFCEPAMPPICG